MALDWYVVFSSLARPSAFVHLLYFFVRFAFPLVGLFIIVFHTCTLILIVIIVTNTFISSKVASYLAPGSIFSNGFGADINVSCTIVVSLYSSTFSPTPTCQSNISTCSRTCCDFLQLNAPDTDESKHQCPSLFRFVMMYFGSRTQNVLQGVSVTDHIPVPNTNTRLTFSSGYCKVLDLV